MTETVSGGARSAGTRRQRGLRLERVFTRPGVHPYDEVTWERRDIVMTNWRDGSINFEQRGVEFPDFWSVNAANIVTTKYFRGAVGTPHRETGLRQLIDRVVQTYRRAGEEHGYFATPADAEVFDHELTHMLLHQVFSFNSPVWFNVGTASPQQVSACQPYDALVSTPAGLVPIGKLVEDMAVGTKVYDANGVTQIVAAKHNGRKEVLRVTTKAGHHLDVTADHLVWRSTGDRTGRFVPAGELVPGDQIEWHRTLAYGDSEILTREIAEAALAGWLQSDGFVGQYEGTNKSLTIEAMTVTDAELAWVTNALDVVIPELHRHERRVATQDTALDCRRTRVYGRGLDEFVSGWGLRARGMAMVVPERLYTAPLPVVAAYLRSIFQAEGYVSARERSTLVGVDMIGEQLIRGVQALLARFGIFARVGRKAERRTNRHDLWGIRIQNAGDRRIFADEIGFIDPVKAAKLEASFDVPGRAALPVKRLEIASIASRGEMDVYDIQTESGEYLSGNLRVHNCFILSVDDTMDSILNWYREEGLIFKGGSGAGLNLSRIRSSKELLSSGGTASGPVSFMRGADASAGTIKSGGATRRAAKMVILDVDHPDIEEFVETKAREEDKIRALRDAGYDMDLGGKDIVSVQYQNANNSVRVNDDFMRAVEEGRQFGLRARSTGEVIETIDAKELFGKIAKAAWECADPGIQYDDTINDWHTTPETGRITASNPCCFVGSTLVETTHGPVAFELVHKSLDAGEQVAVRSLDVGRGTFVDAPVAKSWVAGRTTELVRVTTTSGAVLDCTPEHRFLVDGDAWVEAQALAVDARLASPAGSVRVRGVERIDLDEPVEVYDMEVAGHHNFLVSSEGAAAVVAHNSEYMHLDNSSCNLASLNLLKFLGDDDTFDAATFAKAVEFIITAMDISICFADFPTQAIGETTRAYRQLGIGYANLGALLMATGHAYDSEGGRSLAAAITSLMTGTAYKRSAELAGVVGPYDGYARNAEPHKRVMRKHAAANDAVRPADADAARVLHAATKAWQECLSIGEKNGWRNAQASVLAPTGCLTGDTMITTDRGLVRLDQLGEVYGSQWQDLDVRVSTDEGTQQATKFFVNGEEPTRLIVTDGGYRIQGTLAHRIKVVDEATGEWIWKRLADVAEGDLTPVQLGTLVGEPRRVPLPVLDQAYYAGDRTIEVPDEVSVELAELVGYFMGDGSLHAKGIRFCVANTDLDVVERLRVLGKTLFNLDIATLQCEGYVEVTLASVRLARWWQAAGFAKTLPSDDHVGKGWTPRVPAAVLETNDRDVYAGFLRGLFEADGSVTEAVPTLSTASGSFASEIRTLLLALGMATTTRATVGGWGGQQFQLRLRNLDHAHRYAGTVGFLGGRKSRLIEHVASSQAGNRDRIMLPREAWDQIAPVGSTYRSVVVSSLGKCGAVSRTTAERIQADTPDPRLAHALGYIFERVASNDDGGVQPTYDLSVPSNVTYVANGLVSHNTIGLMMDCDTTGIEPDLALVKFKKLVGGGSMQIVNQTIPRALKKLGYQDEQSEAIVEHIAEHGNVIDAPGLRPEHYEVFDCAMGERSISAMGHVRMMAATQPFISGAISKTVNVPETATVEDIADVYFQGWKLGLKALAIYRDNCKVGQPLSDAKAKKADAPSEAAAEPRLIRKRLPRKRPSQTVSFSVAGAEGYMTAGSYPDDGLGEVFLKLGKQGSTLAGVMDAFSIAISIALQYGVPLETYVQKFTNMRFEPAGMTDDPDIRMAQSVMDYIFRRLALDYLPYDKRAELGIYTAEERAATVATSYGSAPAAPAVEEELDPETLRDSVPVEPPHSAAAAPAPVEVHSSTELIEAQQGTAADAPLCLSCGVKMRPAGSCYVCESCGSTSGCS
jgi:ribonucleoside-diphosphate reductase alpha chain